MANIIRLGGGAGGGGEEAVTIAIHEGKINTSGAIVSDTDYFYTDSIPCPKGKICFDFGDTYSSDAIIAFYEADNTFIDYWGSTQRYRILDFTADYQTGRKMKLSFPKTVLKDTEYIDLAAFTIYSGSQAVEAVLLGEKSEIYKLIDWSLYSHVSDFDSIPLPANYTDYDHLALIIIQSSASQDFNEAMAIAEVEQFIKTGVRGSQILIIDTADITANDTNISIPMMSGNTFGMGTYTYGATKINSSRILGYDYAWSWQNLYLLVLGFND